MGLGDAKLLAMIAAWLGPWLTGLVLFLGVVAGALYGVVMLAAAQVQPREKRQGLEALPFGSFLCGASIYALFYGQQTLEWYMSFFR